MKVYLNEVMKAFDDLIEEKKSREEIASWALKIQIAEDAGDLKYDPTTEESKIWEGISYLTGVDLKDIDGSYLHSIENFIDFRKEFDL